MSFASALPLCVSSMLIVSTLVVPYATVSTSAVSTTVPHVSTIAVICRLICTEIYSAALMPIAVTLPPPALAFELI